MPDNKTDAVFRPLEQLPSTEEELYSWLMDEFSSYDRPCSLPLVVPEPNAWGQEPEWDELMAPRLAIRVPIENTLGHLLARCDNPNLADWKKWFSSSVPESRIIPPILLPLRHEERQLVYFKPSPLRRHTLKCEVIPFAEAKYETMGGFKSGGHFQVFNSGVAVLANELFESVVAPALTRQQDQPLAVEQSQHAGREAGVVGQRSVEGDGYSLFGRGERMDLWLKQRAERVERLENKTAK